MTMNEKQSLNFDNGTLIQAKQRLLTTVPEPLAFYAAFTLKGQKAHTALLESAEPSSQKVQRSILILSSIVSITSKADTVTVQSLKPSAACLIKMLAPRLDAFRLTCSDTTLVATLKELPRNTQGFEHERLLKPSALSVLREILKIIKTQLTHLPQAAMLIGAFAYDFVEQFENLPFNNEDHQTADYQFYLADEMIVIDHLKQTANATVLSMIEAEQKDRQTLEKDLNTELENRLNAIEHTAHTYAPLAQINADPAQAKLSHLRCSMNDEDFSQQVSRLKNHILEGDIFQAVLSREFSVPCQDALKAYQALRKINPGPYMFYFNAGDFILLGSSPESAVKANELTREIEISPIAGTRKRGFDTHGQINRDLDGRIEAELKLDEKENAEHLMLVDLARNDVAKVSQPGSCYVASLLKTQRYSHVMHLVSRVCGTLKNDLDALAAYQASMNMGTLTGAPKIKAMQLIGTYEGNRRGYYGGAIGYLCGDGSFDTAIVIRAAYIKNGIASVRAGAGVVYDSIPQHEADETRRKAEATLRAIVLSQQTKTNESQHQTPSSKESFHA